LFFACGMHAILPVIPTATPFASRSCYGDRLPPSPSFFLYFDSMVPVVAGKCGIAGSVQFLFTALKTKPQL
jgi:hypothetical protein